MVLAEFFANVATRAWFPHHSREGWWTGREAETDIATLIKWGTKLAPIRSGGEEGSKRTASTKSAYAHREEIRQAFSLFETVPELVPHQQVMLDYWKRFEKVLVHVDKVADEKREQIKAIRLGKEEETRRRDVRLAARNLRFALQNNHGVDVPTSAAVELMLSFTAILFPEHAATVNTRLKDEIEALREMGD